MGYKPLRLCIVIVFSLQKIEHVDKEDYYKQPIENEG
jgi:hypothetical protein